MSLKHSNKTGLTKPTEKISCILAPNPSPMTFKGTNTYIIDNGELAVIDPGPMIDEHFNNILDLIGDRQVKYIFLTHSHVDHSPLAKKLSKKLKTPIYAFGGSNSGLSSTMVSLIENGYDNGFEGIDYEFYPDRAIINNEKFNLNGEYISAIHTPGHMGNHICFKYDKVLFSGDHIMGWATSMVSPPYGDLTQFMNSCRVLQKENFKMLLPGHGDPVSDPKERINFLINHRLERERQIKSTIEIGPLTAMEITYLVYNDIDPALINAATRNVFAHLIDLNNRKKIKFLGPLSENTKVSLNL